MKTGRRKKWSLSIWLLGLLMSLLLCPAGAQEFGTIELQFDKLAAGTEITLYSVAGYQDGTFVPQGAFEGCALDFTEISDAQKSMNIAEQLYALAQNKGVEGIAGTVDENGLLRYEDLIPAYYLLVQTSNQDKITIQKILIPIPHTMEDGSLNYTAVVAPKYSIPEGAVILTKVDDTNALVSGAKFRLDQKVYIDDPNTLPDGTETGKEGDAYFYWQTIQTGLMTNEDGQLAVSDLEHGLYRFVETEAPEGLILDETPHYFKIESAGAVELLDGIYTVKEGKAEEVTAVNAQISLKVRKVDAEGNAVAGAKLIIRNAHGEVVFTFTSTEEAYEVKGLPEGEYLLSEIEAPEGYRVSADVAFTVSGEKDAVNEVTMVDEKEEKNTGSLTVSKSLVDEAGNNLIAKSSTFYIALFEDEQRTERISNVAALTFTNAGSASVSFEDLDLDKTYYLGETDALGTLVENGKIGNAAYAPDYGAAYEILLTEEAAEQEYVFKNVFSTASEEENDTGELTITKKVMLGTAPYKVERTFYAAVFADQEYTERVGDVIELKLDGTSEVSVNVPVEIGSTAGSYATYYVAETDEKGEVLDASGLAFVPTVNRKGITFTANASKQTVIITNTYPDAKTSPGGGGSSYSGGGSTGGGGSSVKTGDDTPVFAVVSVMLAALAVIAAIFVISWKKRVK